MDCAKTTNAGSGHTASVYFFDGHSLKSSGRAMTRQTNPPFYSPPDVQMV